MKDINLGRKRKKKLQCTSLTNSVKLKKKKKNFKESKKEYMKNCDYWSTQ